MLIKIKMLKSLAVTQLNTMITQMAAEKVSLPPSMCHSLGIPRLVI